MSARILCSRKATALTARPNSMKALRPQNVKMPPIIHRNKQTPTDPVTAKIPDGVLKIPVPIILLRMTNTEDVIPSFRESSNW
jgi:hypothetical protein